MRKIVGEYQASVILIRMAIRAIIFDLGGVLLRTADFSPREKLANQLGMSRAELEELIFGGDSGGAVQKGEISLEEYWRTVQERLNYSPDEFKALIEVFFAEDGLDHELVDYIRELRRGYKTALLSNATSDLRTQVAEKWHIEDAFDIMVISGEVGMIKPEPGIFKLTLEQLGVEAQEAVFVDDMLRNVDGARKAGLNAIQFQSTHQVQDDIQQLLNAG
jgi:epoxide hydrolase-like predicted phosphatase